MIRVEVEHFPSRNRLCVDVDESLVTDELRTVIDELVAGAATDLDMHPEKVALLLVDELVQRHHDRAAYEREAARRGVLVEWADGREAFLTADEMEETDDE